MFAFLSVLLTYSLLSFGAVQRQSWLTLEMFWVLSSGFLLAFRSVRHHLVDPVSVGFLALCGLVTLLAEPKFGVGLLAAGWGYLAARRHDAGVVRFFNFLLLVGILEALLGLAQYFFVPGWILGYQSPFDRSSGTLINRNHFAGLLEMLIPITLGFAYIAVRRYGEMARPYTYLLAGAFMGLALLFSVSRMGIFSLLLTILFLAILLRLRDSKNRLATGLGLSFVVLLTAGALWIGIDVIVARYSDLLAEDAVIREGRALVFRDTARMISANPLGVGSGNYQDRFRQYQTFRPDLLFDHAHNDYLETMAEWGTPIALAFWVAVIFILVSAVRKFLGPGSPERRGILLTCIGAIFSILVHSLTDFNLQIPSNAMLFFSFVGIAFAQTFRAADYAD